MEPKVSIVLLNWNGLRDTIECLRSIYNQDYQNFDLIVIDNASTDNSVEVIKKEFPDITIIENEKNFGYTGGNNKGIEVSRKTDAEYIWLLNNDTIVASEALKIMVEYAELSEQVGIVSPKVVQKGKNFEQIYFGTYINTDLMIKKNFTSREELTKIDKVEPERICLWGTSLLLKRNLVEKIGYFDDRFFAYYEDMDYSLRSIQAGFLNKVAINAVVYHRLREERPEGIPDYYFFYMVRNEYLFWSKYLKESSMKLFNRKYISAVVRKVAGFNEKNASSYAQVCLDGMWCAYRNKFGVRNPNDKMPGLLKKLILKHPYFIRRLIALKI